MGTPPRRSGWWAVWVALGLAVGAAATFAWHQQQVGRGLGQRVLYTRFSEPRVELTPVAADDAEKGP